MILASFSSDLSRLEVGSLLSLAKEMLQQEIQSQANVLRKSVRKNAQRFCLTLSATPTKERSSKKVWCASPPCVPTILVQLNLSLSNFGNFGIGPKFRFSDHRVTSNS